MRHRAWLIASFVVASCTCPSVWLSVTQRDRGPRSPVPMPAISDPPFLYPPSLDNRFKVLGVSPSAAMLGYVDSVDPRDQAPPILSGSLQAIDELAVHGVAGAPALRVMENEQCFSATIESCPDDACDIVTVHGTPPAKAVVARISGGDWTVLRAVETCVGLVAGHPEVTLACGDPSSAGSWVRLSRPLPTTTAPQGVAACFSAEARLSETLFTFVHLSDAQLRDPDIKLENPELSARLDWLIQSFEHDDDQEFYNPYLLEALVATINAIVDSASGADKPRLMIHTGDLIDAGVMGEIAQAHRIFDRLVIPWYNALGNHDTLVFGNLLPAGADGASDQCVEAKSIAAPYRVTRPIWGMIPNKLCIRERVTCAGCGSDPAETFVAGANHVISRANFIGELDHPDNVAVEQPVPHCGQDEDCRIEYTVNGVDYVIDEAPVSRLHGFDVSKHDDAGYYAFRERFTIDGGPRDIFFVVLNSEDLKPGEGGNAGRLQKQQLDWLKATLDRAKKVPKSLIFVFAHHSVGDMKTDGESFEAVLDSATPNLVGYFYGHNHKNGLCREGRATACTRFWEIEGGSLVEFPQEGRLIRIKSVGSGIAFLEVVTFTERLAEASGTFAHFVDLARRGAERDHCRSHGDARCSEDLRVRRADARHTAARLFFKLPP